MDKLLEELEELTQTMVSRLMDAPYEELENFVNERQNLVDAIGKEVENCQMTSEQKEVLGRIMEHDSAIVARMNAHRLEARELLQKRNQAKAQRSAYEASYAPDSILMDRKK
ncbi:flagellar protein FliT [Paenibacillus tianjinensis]|uniref:Flagellar protein FliT n=1 Tax=Paenibacillus tianjinensis TaxID=2810347 RepID=A0ABX7LFL4_9BACL|nr:flagellar protein FliT [Paenibacillus tianjinensis]QSF44732.1 flagellar protein FliT [Paenibacillus tianjinensis]